jgi:pyruvate-formate lyase-activating enzyme
VTETCSVKEVARSPQDRATLTEKDAFVEPRFLSQIGLFLTFRCTIRCRHCMVRSGPHRTEEVDIDIAHGWLEQMAACGVKSIGFTGGEPFCCWNKLLDLAQAARRLGLTYTVITNGFWATSKQKTRDMLTQLQPTDISVSTDIFHAEHIPLDNVERILEASQDLCIRCDISLAYDTKRLEQTRSLVKSILTFAPREAIRISRIFPSGRGEQVADFGDKADKVRSVIETPCLFATVPYILPRGDVIACVGPIINLPRKHNPLFLGSLRQRSLEEIFDESQNNPILHGLRIWGPRFWHRLVEAHGPKSELPKSYYTDCPCEGCMTLLKNSKIAAFLSEAVYSIELRSYVSIARQVLLRESPCKDGY